MKKASIFAMSCKLLLNLMWFLIGCSGYFMSTSTYAYAHDDTSRKLCIRTEPTPALSEAAGDKFKTNDTYCDVLATIITAEERETLIEPICKDLHGPHKEYYYFKMRNGDLIGHNSYHKLCAAYKWNPLLAWVSYEQMQHFYAQELDPREHIKYIAKATAGVEKSELCYFRQTDLAGNTSTNLFTCIHMVVEHNFYGIDSEIYVLVELQPILYEMYNITYLPWTNTSKSYKASLGCTTLRNLSGDKRRIYGSISYAYFEKVKLNLSIFDDNEQFEMLPILIDHKGSLLELDAEGNCGMHVKERAFFGRVMEPKTTLKVDVIGQWALHCKQFNADIYENFGYGVKRFKTELHNAEIQITRIDHTEPVYEMPNEINVELNQFDRLIEKRNGASFSSSTYENDDLTIGEEQFKDGHPYPEFYFWFVTGALIFGVVLLIAVYGMIQSYSKNEEKRQYKLTGV